MTMVVATLWVPLPLQGMVVLSVWGMFAALLVVATLASFVAAWRRKLISRSTCLVCLATWFTLAAGSLCLIFSHGRSVAPEPAEFQLLHCSLVGLAWSIVLLLPLLPVAATPLAVAWNRHR